MIVPRVELHQASGPRREDGAWLPARLRWPRGGWRLVSFRGRTLAGWALLAALAGCAALDTGADTPALPPVRDPIPAAPKVVGPPKAAERDDQRLVSANGGAYRQAALDRYLDDIVQRLAAESDRPDIPYRLTVLDSPAINAFALPSGLLYVTRGLLALCNDSAEIAAVIGHEMAHVSQRHALARQNLERQSALVSQVMIDVLHDPAAGQAHTEQSLVTIASFSRAQELDADQIGIRTMAHAGFDPAGAARFLSAMSLQQGSNSGSNDFLASHPTTPERVQRALAEAQAFGSSGEHDHVGFLEAIDGLPYAEDPQQGYVQGTSFLHPRLGFAFTAPDGFTLDNTPQAILGLDGRGRALRLDAVKIKADLSLTDYVRTGWIDGVSSTSIQVLPIGGFEGATALGQGDDWTFRLYAIRFGTDVYRLVFAARQMTAEAESAFRRSAMTFRRLRPEEANAPRPFRIEVVTVRAGDTIQSLAARMAVPDRPLERFAVLNDLQPEAALRAGQRVKIVAR